MEQKTIWLPPSIIRIIEDICRRKGTAVAAECRTMIIEHMLATDKAFVCDRCDEYMAYDEMSDDQDVCVVCKSR